MIILIFNANLSRYIGNGPFFPNDGYEVDSCKTNWWQNLLYINNFFNFDTSVNNLE